MAKTKANSEEDEVLDKTATTSTEKETEETAGGESSKRDAEEVKVNTAEKRVKIHIVEAVDCMIACVPYNLTKDKAYSVPSDVAAILVNSKKAYRI